MCGRYASTSSLEDLAEYFEVDQLRAEPGPERYNVAPSLDVYAVATRRPREGEDGPVRQLGTFRWGLVPIWAKDPSVGNRMINARAETVATNRSYRDALSRRRCLIPADAFYEWQARPGPRDERTGKPGKGSKLPWAVRRVDGRPMAFAGLWERWRERDDPDAPWLRTCVIVTTEANEALAPIHDRMPVILAPEAWGQWLDPALTDPAGATPLLKPAPAEWLEAFPVSSRVNTATNEGPELLAPLPLPPAGLPEGNQS